MYDLPDSGEMYTDPGPLRPMPVRSAWCERELKRADDYREICLLEKASDKMKKADPESG